MENLILYSSQWPKQRIGRPNDGGYVIANLPGTYDALISGGISDDISFEIDFLNMYKNVPCFAFDGTVSGLPTQTEGIQFIQKNLGSENTNITTNLHEYMIERHNIFLKIDIEGHEFHLFPKLITSQLIKNVKQLVMEIHTPNDILLNQWWYKGVSKTNKEMFSLFNGLNATHTLIHIHANNACKMQTIDGISLPHVFEVTYIRNDYITEIKNKNSESLPTKLDMPNIVHLPDISLHGFPYTHCDSS